MTKCPFPVGSDGRASACNEGDLGLIPGVRKIPCKREWQPAPVFLPKEFHGQRSLVGYIQFMGSQRVGHDGATFTFTFFNMTKQVPSLWLKMAGFQ